MIYAIWDQPGFPIPNTQLTLKGYSRAACRTSFYIPELKLALDCSLPFNFTADNVFITHKHSDHMCEIHMYDLSNKSKGHIYVPNEIKGFIINFIQSANETASNIRGVNYNDKFDIKFGNNNYLINIFRCYHSTTCVGYGISQTRTKLLDEYKNLTKKEIIEIKKSGIVITKECEYNLFCYLGDTTIEVFNDISIFNFCTIIVECTFLYDEHLEMAKEKTHMHWSQLQPIILTHPNNFFILYHFSTRYSDKNILYFFENKITSNMKLWI